MEKILGNYLTQPNRDFPLDAETLDYLQQLSSLAAIVGNIAGDKIVLLGCEANLDGTHRNAGWVFLRTRAFPEGEVLHWEGGSTDGGVYVKQDDISVSVNNSNYPKAYTRRRIAPGYGEENYSWDDFTDIKTMKEILAENDALRREIAALQPPPLGVIQMWAGTSVPNGYLLCDGQQLRQSEYPELYKALGTSFNQAVSANGIPYTTAPGFFRLPDLRGRFVVGKHDSDRDYSQCGAAGGEKSVILGQEQLPAHSHPVKDYYYAESNTSKVNGTSFDVINTNNKIGSGDTDMNNDHLVYHLHNTEFTGGGQSHENRPPYYVLAYIIRVK